MNRLHSAIGRQVRGGALWLGVVSLSGCHPEVTAKPSLVEDAGAPLVHALPPSVDAPGPVLDVTVPVTVAVDSAWCRARAVLREHCWQCHGNERRAGAPMSLVTYSDLVASAFSDHAKKVYELVEERTHDTQTPMPPTGNLSVEAQASLDAWIKAGAPAGADPDCSGQATDASVPAQDAAADDWPADCEVFYTLRAHDLEDPSKPFVVKAGQEIQRSIAIDAPWGDEKLQALAFRARNDNLKILHHWVLYEGAPPGVSADAGEQTPSTGTFLWGWVPGNDGRQVELPDDVGLYLPTGQLSLDMHYYNVAGTTDELDQSGVEICATRHFRPKTASVSKDFNAFMNLPPNQTTSAQDLCRVVATTSEGIHLLASAPHMHKLGTHGFLSVTHGSTENVLIDKPFSFGEQRFYELGDVQVQTGDVVTTRCTFNNTTNHVVGYGPSSDKEMCANFTIYWPKDGYFCLGF